MHVLLLMCNEFKDNMRSCSIDTLPAIMRTAQYDAGISSKPAADRLVGPHICLQYDVGDCRSMPQYEDAAFAAVIDKGTLDAIMCGEHAEADAVAMVLECHRYAQPTGLLVLSLSSLALLITQPKVGNFLV